MKMQQRSAKGLPVSRVQDGVPHMKQPSQATSSVKTSNLGEKILQLADTIRLAHRKITSPTAISAVLGGLFFYPTAGVTPSITGKKTGPAASGSRCHRPPAPEGAHGAVTKPAHWSWDRAPVGNQPPRIPDCHFREANACSTLQLTGKSTASDLADKPMAASARPGDFAALRFGA